MEFNHEQIEALWLDFSTSTMSERTMTSIETIFRNFSLHPKKHQKKEFRFDNKTFIARFYPTDYTKKQMNVDEFDLYLSYPDTVRYIFRVSTPFVVITVKNDRITEKQGHAMISTLAPTAQSSEFVYPVFINIPLKTYILYTGFCSTNSRNIHYYSNTIWKEIEQVDTYQNALNFFKNNFCSPKAIIFSARQQMDIENIHFSKDAFYSHDCYYSKVATDPIYRLKIFFQWNPVSADSFEPHPSNASHLRVTTEYKMNYSHRTSMHSFIKRLSSLNPQNDSFKIWLANLPIDSKILSAMNEIMNPNNYLHAHSIKTNTTFYFKSAPENSLIERVAIEIANSKTLANFASIWTEFLKRIRENVQKKIVLPGVDSILRYSNCLIYQNIQVINSYLSNPNSNILLLTEDRFNEFKEIYQKTSNQSILQQMINSFKYQNPDSSFDTFYQIIFSNENQEKSNDLNDNKNLVFDLWNSEKVLQIRYDENIEIALDYLESLKPSEVYFQLVPVMLDAAFRDISRRAPIEIPFANEAYKLIKKAYENCIEKNMESYVQVCRAIEENTLKFELVNSALTKIPSAKVVNQLFENGFCAFDASDDIESVSALIEVMNLDGLFDHVTNREYVFTGISNHNNEESFQYLFVSKQQADDIKGKYVVATVFQECL
ncbi:hypothetical protein TRFO_01074 [Tritrichomonas foetus]|uniref:Uncharacterized protein n=1 Tax=Tritrichomonas foetus TaxID=1144522 RepID=A0A1J4KIW0_9EUKA|nr:hypothetical protein TRFO_01074 [Tritrichomonas foetus]|eukprot:OHT11171.1 hypothetical protein TRFO_01074 [Tritrichomonas foetus]